MSPNTLTHEAGEKQTPNLDHEIREARADFYGLQSEDEFLDYCDKKHIDIANTENPKYWTAVADYAYNKTSYAKDSGEDTESHRLTELFAATPDFIYSQKQLENRHLPRDQRRVLKERVSYYNGLIRNAAENHSSLTTTTLKKTLLGIAEKSIEDHDLQSAATNMIHYAVRGAQHELGFGQLLEAVCAKKDSVVEFYKATVEEDLNGIDYIVEAKNGRDIAVDVKSSLSEIKSQGNYSTPYTINMEGKLTMQSLLTDQDFEDRFYVSEGVINKKAEVLNRLFNHILDDERHPQHY